MDVARISNHPKDLKKLIKILTNISKHPNEQKYRDLNVKRVKKLFINYDQCLHLLYNAGFQISDDNKRLYCGKPNLNQVKSLTQKLELNSSITSDPKIEPNFDDLFPAANSSYVTIHYYHSEIFIYSCNCYSFN